MPVYQYQATNSQQTLVKGTIAGANPRDAREMLRAQGMSVVEIVAQPLGRTTANWNGFLSGLLPRRKGRYLVQTTNFVRELATLQTVDVPILEAIDTLAQQYNGSFQAVLLDLKDRVGGGASLADGMRAHPDVFSDLAVRMVEVGESTGSLDSSLRKLGDFQQRSLAFKDRVLSAMLYPAIILSTSVGVCLLLMTIVIPELLNSLTEAGRQLPWPTRVLKFCSDVAIQHGWWLAIVAATAVISAGVGFSRPAGKRLWYRLLAKVPLLGPLHLKQEVARICLIIATLLQSGIDFVEAIRVARGTMKNPLLFDALQSCEQNVESGREIGQALHATDYFPPMVTQVFSIGQKSGRLDEMLEQLAIDYDSQVETASARISTTIEPILIIVLSVFVGFILFATLLPILEAGNDLSN